jgi:hypothetical protein
MKNHALTAALALLPVFALPIYPHESDSPKKFHLDWRIILHNDTLDLFLKGQCVGFCRQSFSIDESAGTVNAETDFDAGGASESERLFASDSRVYGFDGRLRSAEEGINSAEGASKWHLVKDTGAAWNLTVTAGGMTRAQPVQGVTENLNRTYELYRGIKDRSIKRGDVFTDTIFDLTSGKTMTEVTRCIETPSAQNGFCWVFSDMQSVVGRLDTLKIDTAGATVFAGQFPFVMRKRNRTGVTPAMASLWDVAKALSVPAQRPARENERIAMVLDSTLRPDSSVRRFYERSGDKWVLNDMPAECPKSGGVLCNSAVRHDYVSPTVTMQSDNPKIKKLADSLVRNAPTRCDSIDACFRWVYATLEKRPSPTFANALEVLQSGFGDCKEHSVLLGALLRAVKIPARVIYGLVYWQHKGYSYHAWVMAESNDTWLFVDPALGVFPAYRDRAPLLIDDFGSESVKMAKFIGRIEIEYVKKYADNK